MKHTLRNIKRMCFIILPKVLFDNFKYGVGNNYGNNELEMDGKHVVYTIYHINNSKLETFSALKNV